MHPLAMSALVVVVLNDQVLKDAYPSPITGKLSDFAGLVYFPLFVVACIESVRWLFNRSSWELSPRSVVVAAVILGVLFAVTKTWHPAALVYRPLVGVVRWPADAMAGLIRGRGLAEVRAAHLTEDPSDLVALVVLALPVWISRRVMVRPVDPDSDRGWPAEPSQPAEVASV